MKRKMKKLKNKPFKIISLIIGVLILIWNIFWFVKVEIMSDYESVTNLDLYTIGIYILLIYTLITSLFLLIKWFRNYRLKKLKEVPL